MRQRRSAFALPAVFDDAAKHVCPKVVALYMVLIAANLLAWAWAFTAFHDYPLLLATALIAYGLGCGMRSMRTKSPRSAMSRAN
jgi:high-affinity nickel permease